MSSRRLYGPALFGMSALLLLSACGGGGGSGGGGAATPVGEAQGGTFAFAGGDGSGSAPVVQGSSGPTMTITVNGQTKTFSHFVQSSAGLQRFTSTDGGATVISSPGTLSVAGIRDGEPFAYTQFGVWLEGPEGALPPGSTATATTVTSFAVGNATPVEQMPRQGSATFRGEAVAVERASGALPRVLSGSFTATANFANRRVDATADLLGADDGQAFGRVTMQNLTVSGNTFEGAASSAGYSGTIKGGFAGPGAEEMAGVFELNGATRVNGGFAAKR